ncbi:acyl-CoA dehydrogenase family protein [soil metagenome]
MNNNTSTLQKSSLNGGEWLIKDTEPSQIFVPEQFTEEQRMILEMCKQFMEAEVFSVHQITDKDPSLVLSILKKAGAQGLLGVSVPEAYGGLGKDFVTSSVLMEGLGYGYSFSVSYLAHTGIGTMPILYFGNENQRQKYVSKLATGEWIGAYGLTEPGSGSDALSAKTTAILSEDGKHYILNGQKCWITNGGFADVFTVFAKIDGDKFTAFIIERGFEGFTNGPEEHKMGIKGSSTVQLYFQDCKVPVENVLGEIGRGHIIAFNILNIGRYKLCAATIGAGKAVTNLSLKYAINREQFKQPIANFGAIKHKLAKMAIGTWVTESATYRVSKMIEEKENELLEAGETFDKAFLGAAEEYAVECAMLKVFGSELLDFCVDEGLQIHGGNGFSDEYEISKAYRDSRINRIYEGTNEINRLLTVDMLLKRAMKGKLDLMGPAMAVSKELMSIPSFDTDDDTAFAKERKYISNFKKAILLVAGAAVQKLMMKLDQEQEVLMNIADMTISVFTAESALLRLMKITDLYGREFVSVQQDIVNSYIYDAADNINKAGKDALNAFADGDELRMMHIGLKRYTKVESLNIKTARRNIAEKMIANGSYCFDLK